MEETGWLAGTASYIVTPPLGMEMAGYILPRRAESVLDDLRATALVLEAGGHRCAFVGVDVLALSEASVARIRAIAAATAGVPPTHLMVAASHTHTGPTTVEIFHTTPDPGWLSIFEAQVAGAVALAARDMRPARLRVGTGREDSFMFNRRLLSADGRVEMTQDQSGEPGVLQPEGPIDPTLGVLRVDDVDGRPRALLVNYANHPDIPTGARYSADYPGVMSRAVQRLLGEEVTVVFLNGACGNLEHLNPFDPEDLATRRDRYHDTAGVEKMVRYGTILGAEVVRTALAIRSQSLAGPPAALVRRLRLPVRPVAPEIVAWAEGVLRQAQPSLRESTFAREALAVHAMRGQAVELELQVIALGGAAVVGIPAEVFVEIGLAIKSRSPYAHTFVAELAGGWAGYLPTARAFQHGGYEVRPARSSKLGPEAEPIVVETVLEMLSEVATSQKGAMKP